MTAPTRVYPTEPPPGVPRAQLKAKLWRCMACRGHLHESCPGAVRMPKYGLWRCFCCGTDPRCLECGSTEDVNQESWSCNDAQACRHQVEIRLANSPLWRMLQAARAAGIADRRRRRMDTAKIWQNVPTDEEDAWEATRRSSTPKRSGSGNCECCGQPTKGGKFLPGHDAKLKSRLRRRVLLNNDQEAARELQERGWA